MTITTAVQTTIVPVTMDRWNDLAALFGDHGACAGCWCMWFRLPKKEYDKLRGDGTRATMQALVQSGHVPGLLAYDGAKPVGWCAVAPRSEYPRLANSRILKPVDHQPVWSVVCFFIAKSHRRMGMTTQLLRGAIDYVKEQGGAVLEGYALDPGTRRIPDTFAFYGLLPAFQQAGFVEVARRSETRPIMRYYINGR